MKHVDPEESFRPALKAVFPHDELIIVKSAQSGEPIRRWYKKWRPRGEMEKIGELGRLYDILMTEVKKATEGKPVPDTVTFIWMQGEADTHTPETYGVYEESLKGLIAQIRGDLKRPDTFVVIGRISDFADYPEGMKAVREAEMSVANGDPLSGWVDTDDLNGKHNGLHYSKEGYRTLGERFAARAIELIQKGRQAKP
ncbi:MAG: sialate O-acetylesterase [Candidatus Methylacidiphilales bacterium]|nr:sialate O-acetylesterase [Candidatus Methylacidiphilales bacterium]